MEISQVTALTHIVDFVSGAKWLLVALTPWLA